jgi:acetate kinase
MSTDQIVVINAGSSSIKFALFCYDATLKKSLSGQVKGIKSSPQLTITDATGQIIREQRFDKALNYAEFYDLLINAFSANQFDYRICAVGHRVVHGGTHYTAPVMVNKEVLHDLTKLNPFAPLHQPYNCDAIARILEVHPDLPQVACFDTAFHHTHPAVADQFGLPRDYYAAGVRRYGFHGLSYEYIQTHLQAILPNKAAGRIIAAHLGNGASLCAIFAGKAIDSTMGFTALDGLLMGTRCGSLDPGVVLFLMQQKQMSCEEIETLLYKKSGLLGVSGITHDMQQLLKDPSPAGQEAIALYVYRIRRELGALAGVLGGLDMLIFTGGIGENAWQIRAAVCDQQAWLGIALDAELNKKHQPLISKAQSQVEIRIIPTDEEWVIAKHTYELVTGDLVHAH